MNPSIWRRIDALARDLAPCALTSALLIAGILPLHIPAFASASPALTLIAVFYWTLYRPDLMPAWTAFVLGLLQDILLGMPLGVGACVLIAVHALANTQRRFFAGKSFGVTWTGFAGVALLASMLGWALTCAYYGVLLAPRATLFEWLVTIGLFPLLSRLLLRCHLALLRQT
jgi:rod shape-determining protein MreD